MVTRKGNVIEIDPILLPSLDFWEVGIYTSDKIFHSVRQATRPLKRKTILPRLTIPEELSGQPIVVRMVLVNEEQTQIFIP